jgi:hypothetical protein
MPPRSGLSYGRPIVTLQPIDEANRAAVEALAVTAAQEQFVAGVAESLVEAVEDPGGRAIHWAVYADETPVGFVMISGEGDGSPLAFYEHYGFRQTGDRVFDDEILLRLELAEAA